MKAISRLANREVRVVAALAVLISASIGNFVLASKFGYDGEWGILVLSVAAFFLGKHV